MRPVYHHHLKKCGGTSLNRWLDQQADDGRCWNPDWQPAPRTLALDSRHNQPSLLPTAAKLLRQHAISAFYWADVIHEHSPMLLQAPGHAFCFTMLRGPVSRLLSEVADWRRLTDRDCAHLVPEFRACMEDARTMPLAPFLERHGRGAARDLLDNYQVRAIAESRLGPLAQIEEAGDLIDAAQIALERDYHFIGVAEQAAAARQSICARLGWAPSPFVPRLNASVAEIPAPEIAEAADLLHALTRHDATLYRRACELFETAHAADAAYDTDVFERTHAANQLRTLQGARHDGATVYSVRGPLHGHGWHGRDGAGTADCAVWTGPGTTARLYIPVPARQKLTLLVWIRGYAHDTQRDTLGVQVDGSDHDHRFYEAAGYHDLLAVDATPRRDFVRLDIHVAQTFTCGLPGEPGYDERHRGVSFDRYGWALC